MAKLIVCAVYDAKVQSYMQPFFCRTKGEAHRMWEGTVNSGDSLFSKHPADFTLFHVADYDDQVGRFSQLEVLVPIATALEAIKPVEDQPIRLQR